MLVSDLISKLEILKTTYGDLPIAFKDDQLGWVYTYNTHSIESTKHTKDMFLLMLYKETHDY